MTNPRVHRTTQMIQKDQHHSSDEHHSCEECLCIVSKNALTLNR